MIYLITCEQGQPIFASSIKSVIDAKLISVKNHDMVVKNASKEYKVWFDSIKHLKPPVYLGFIKFSKNVLSFIENGGNFLDHPEIIEQSKQWQKLEDEFDIFATKKKNELALKFNIDPNEIIECSSEYLERITNYSIHEVESD